MKIYNTNQEIGCRILLILQIVKETYSIERIGYYDYFSLHFSDLKKTGESLHPSNPNHSAEIIIKRHTIENAITFLIGKGLIEPQYNSQGIKYQNTNLGNKIVDMFNNEYTKKYQYYVTEVDKIFSKMNEDKIRNYVNKNIGKWIGEFEKNEK